MSIAAPTRAAAAALATMLAGCAGVMTAPVPVSPFPEAAFGSWARQEIGCGGPVITFSGGRVEARSFESGLSETTLVCEIEEIVTALFDTPVATYELSCFAGAAGPAAPRRWDLARRGPNLLLIDRRGGAGPEPHRRCGAPPTGSDGLHGGASFEPDGG